RLPGGPRAVHKGTVLNPLDSMSLPVALGALLLAGHALGEFVTGPEGRGLASRGGAAWVKHGGAMALWHLLLLLPLAAAGHASVLIALVVVVPGHLLVDWAVDHLPFPEVRALERILVDQLAHLAVLW